MKQDGHRWKKGESGNPAGRPKEFVPFRAIVTPAQEKLARKALDYHLKRKNAKVVMWFYDQLHGKAPQPVTGDGGAPISVTFVENLK